MSRALHKSKETKTMLIINRKSYSMHRVRSSYRALTSFAFAIENHAVECKRKSFACGIRSRHIRTRTNTLLRKFRNSPIFTIGRVPELHRVISLKIRFRHLFRMEIPFANYFGVVHRLRPQPMSHHVVWMQAEQQIWVDGVIKDCLTLRFAETWKVIPAPLPVTCHRLCCAAEFHRAADVGGLRLVVVSAHGIGDAAQHGMKYRTVQALIVVRDDQLPIGLHIVDILFECAQIAHPPGTEFLRKICQLRRKRFRLRCQIQEDVSVPHFSVHCMQRVVLSAKAGFVHVQSTEEFSIQSISPAVIRALNATRECPALFRTDAGSTVPTNVVESMNPTAILAGNNEAFACDLAQKIVAGVGDLFSAPAAEPHLAEDCF